MHSELLAIAGERFELGEPLRANAAANLAAALAWEQEVTRQIGALMDLAIADFAADLTSDYAIVEFVDDSDPMLERLALQRNRRAGEFGRLRQEAAFQRRFAFVARHVLPGSGRCLVLMRRLAA